MTNEPVATPGQEVVDFAHGITRVERDKHLLEQPPRRACVALFNLLGREHPLAQHWRRRFDMALY